MVTSNNETIDKILEEIRLKLKPQCLHENLQRVYEWELPKSMPKVYGATCKDCKTDLTISEELYIKTKYGGL